MAPMRGIKNKKVILEPETQLQDEPEIVPDKPQTSKDAKLKALRKEVETLTEAIWNQ